VLCFRGNDLTGEILPAIQEVVDAGIVRIIDVLLAIRVGDDPTGPSCAAIPWPASRRDEAGWLARIRP
jgi:hypothetical protein